MNHIASITFLLLFPLLASAQAPLLHVRADSLVTRNADGRVTSWHSVSGSAVLVPDTTKVRPLYVADGMNGRPTLRFANDGYLEGPSIFPTANDYTLYVVMRWNGQSASNNLVSGTTRALFLATSPYPRVIHSANFSQLAQSTVDADGPTVVRVEYEESTGRLKLALNNRIGDDVVIPQNTDPTLFIGSYVRDNFFWGDIAEVVLYDRLLDSTERTKLETDLHDRYNIPRVPDPLPPVVMWERVPSPLHFIPEGGELLAQGTVSDNRVQRVTATLDSAGIVVQEWTFVTSQTKEIRIARPVSAGLYTYRLTIDAVMTGDTIRRIVDADGIVCGEAIAIEGQSNSIFGDASLGRVPYARTFGSNFGQAANDTLFKESIASGNGGGANVGAWGLRLQQLIATERSMPTCVINGGVGGTRIEQHFPDANNRMNRQTIYGSWLYRIDKSGLRNHIRWLFWYQGESNNGADDYASLFATLYAAWKADLPNLEHVVVVQIRPGCGGDDHARLRDDQRRLQDLYDDVIVHTACALPAHDGCHFGSVGYRDLGDQMYRLYRDTEDGIESPDVLAPTFATVRQDVTNGDISITTKNARSLQITQANGQPLTSAFFFNGTETLRPDSAWIVGTSVVLRPSTDVTVNTVSYVPSKNDPFTSALYSGPWITDEVGSGMLTFHNISVIPSSVDQESAVSSTQSIICVMDVSGRVMIDPSNLSPGAYLFVFGEGASRTCQLKIVTE